MANKHMKNVHYYCPLGKCKSKQQHDTTSHSPRWKDSNNVEKLEPSYGADGNVKWCEGPLRKTGLQFPKWYTQLPHNPLFHP